MNNKKEEYWNHFLNLKSFWGYKVTLKRLENIKDIIWYDNEFWSDILDRHNGKNMTPEEMKENKPELYEHCFGNFAGMIYQTMIEYKIIKI